MLGLARWLAFQAAALHSPAELELALAAESDGAADWSWLKWLPHVRNDADERIGIGRVGARAVVEALVRLHEEREGQSRINVG